jgi:hypothetical protein
MTLEDRIKLELGALLFANICRNQQIDDLTKERDELKAKVEAEKPADA